MYAQKDQKGLCVYRKKAVLLHPQTEKACEKGDAIKAAKILDQMEKKYPNEADWTLEQQERMEKASIELSKKSLEDASDMLDAFKGL